MGTSKVNNQGRVSSLHIGSGGRNEVVCGGHVSLPFLHAPYQPPLLALAVYDVIPTGHNQFVKKAWPEGDFMARLKKAEYHAPDLLCIRFISADPLLGISAEKHPAELVRRIRDVTDRPLIVTGCGGEREDEELVPLLGDALKGEHALLGVATDKNYRMLSASCLANGHSLIAETPIDINLAKQLNILIRNTGFPLERIVMHHVTAALGYGLEYCYSVIEKSRIGALEGDRLLSPVMLNFVGKETWKTREARRSESLGISWEVTTAISYLEAGADIIVLDHPVSLLRLRAFIESLARGK